eukprot:TRINITY_DN42621_c0_g1_i1.p1 TRINITY_DN42621_c0_g1~~TRINITY_DN42621_c0_g1_i1.p1  ORF type:complete len:415 (-),score=68.06 TRINITY_DN42621_c0_g1_i1:3-1217(-)
MHLPGSRITLPGSCVTAVRCRGLLPEHGCSSCCQGSAAEVVRRSRTDKVQQTCASWRNLVLLAGTASLHGKGVTRAASSSTSRQRPGAVAAKAAPLDERASSRSWNVFVPMLVGSYVLCDVSQYLVAEFASNNYVQPTVLFMSALTSVTIGSVASLVQDGRRGLSECWKPRNVISLVPVSASFCIAKLFFLSAFPHFNGAFIKLLSQLKLPLTAFLSAIFLGRKYTMVQWQVIFAICSSCTCFLALKVGAFELNSLPVFGFSCLLISIFFNVFASLLAERAFKQTRHLSFSMVMVNMRIGEMLTTVLMLAAVPGFRPTHMFHNWDVSTVMILVALIADAWFSAMLVKRLSSVTKSVAKCSTLVALYGISLVNGKQPWVLAEALVALVVVQSTALFVTVSKQAKQ